MQHYQVPHQYCGTIIMGLLIIQASLGQVQHSIYLKTQKRSIWSYGHIWLGRFVIIAGMVNGGVGLSLPRADAPNSAIIAYSVVAGVIGIGYLAFYFWKERKREVGVFSS